MKEIGGYIELDTYTGKMLYDDGIKLNCGRNALAYLIKAKNIKKIYMPKFMCDSCNKVLRENGVKVIYYSIGMDFKPQISFWDGWLYVVNFYGQLSNEFLASLGKNVIIDNAHTFTRTFIINQIILPEVPGNCGINRWRAWFLCDKTIDTPGLSV